MRAEVDAAVARRAPAPADGTLATTGITGLGLSSLAVIDLVLDLESAFGVVFPDALLVRATFESVDSVVAAVLRLLR